MKIKVFKFKGDTETEEKNTVFENILFSTCILCFVVLIVVQTILAVPSLRSLLHLTDKSLGLPLTGDEYLYNQGQITLNLVGEEPDPNLRILINGDAVGQFDSNEVVLNVKDEDVIELDGSQNASGHIVQVKAITTNISSKCKNAVLTTENKIKRLVKVQID